MSQNRLIFQDVADTCENASQAVSPGNFHEDITRRRFAYACFIFSALLLLMVVIGGITRVTDSGLSITQWEVIRGIIPPLNHSEWQEAFGRYQIIPEFTQQNSWMTLADFKKIYIWEWLHRLYGRFLGLLVIMPLFIPRIRKLVPVGYMRHWVTIIILITCQGAIGWWMVSSGLAERVDVSPYRLAVHLSLAFVIMSYVLVCGMRLMQPEWLIQHRARNRNLSLVRLSISLAMVLFMQNILGALVAGGEAAKIYLEWPMMGDTFFPYEAISSYVGYMDIISDPAIIQFIHRTLAYLIIVLSIMLWWKVRRSAYNTIATYYKYFLLCVLAQVMIGIGILEIGDYHRSIALRVIHQTVSFVVFASYVRFLFEVYYSQGISEVRVTAT